MAPKAEKKPAAKKPAEEEPATEKAEKAPAGKKPKAEKRLPAGKSAGKEGGEGKRGRKKGMRAGGSLTRGEKGGSRRGIRSQLFAATLVNGACDWPNPVRKRLLLQWPHC